MHEENQNLLDQFAMAALNGILTGHDYGADSTEYFAEHAYSQAHAMQGILSGILIGFSDHRGVADSAYCQAEAMMKERERSLKE